MPAFIPDGRPRNTGGVLRPGKRAAAASGATALVAAAVAACGDGPATARVPPAHAVTIGHSLQGRAIRGVRLGPAHARTRVLVVGSIHGNEPAGRAVVHRLRREQPPRNVALWLVVDVNPDGSARGTRQNAHGVDLNRNFPYRWRRAGTPGSQYYSGPRPFSEPETRAIRRLTRRLRPRVSIWYHQPWGHVVLPRRGGRVPRRYARLARFPAHRLHGARARLRGTAISWQKHVLPGASAFVVELPARSVTPREAARHARAAARVSAGSR
jgi:protein MpaA